MNIHGFLLPMVNILPMWGWGEERDADRLEWWGLILRGPYNLPSPTTIQDKTQDIYESPREMCKKTDFVTETN